MVENENENEYPGPLPIILDDEPFKLSYMKFDDSRYSEFYCFKAEAFLRKMLSYGDQICHDFELNEESVVLDARVPNFSLPNHMSAICSPARHCRERVRFPIYHRSAFRDVEAMFPEKVERFWADKKHCDEPEEELVYTMWEGGGGSALVHVSTLGNTLLKINNCLYLFCNFLNTSLFR